jgi:transposase
MRKIREVLRLHAAGRSQRQIAASVGIGQSTVGDYLTRARLAGISERIELDDAALERALYPPKPALPAESRGLPDWAYVHRELKRKGVTLFLLWEEYKAAHPQGFHYSWFCQHYREWAGKIDVVMRHDHRAGESLLVDYAGQKAAIVDRETGEIQEAEVFVAVLGASSYTFAEATWTQSLPDWIGSHQRAFAYIGGVPESVVVDNLKSGVTKAHRYEPDINPTYAEMAAHYGVAILPTRVGKPRDKAKAEVAVQIVERWILARLRNQTFFSLGELNRAM